MGALSPHAAAAVLSRRPMVALQREDIADCTARWRSWGEQREYRDIDGNVRLLGWKAPKRDRPRCGAKTRAGGSCNAPAIPGKERCRMHGGLRPDLEPRQASAAHLPPLKQASDAGMKRAPVIFLPAFWWPLGGTSRFVRQTTLTRTKREREVQTAPVAFPAASLRGARPSLGRPPAPRRSGMRRSYQPNKHRRRQQRRLTSSAA